jgi:hypothetical protein
MLPTTSSAKYLIEGAREEIFRVFYLRNNEPMEFSAIRIVLEAQGVRAKHENHWGLLALAMVSSGIFRSEGRAPSIVASRHNAKNSVYRLTDEIWAYVKNVLGPVRGWEGENSRKGSQVGAG